MKNQHRNNYSALSEEYYNEIAHPTCANLGLGSRILLNSWLTSIEIDGKVICEVGAGRSALADLWPIKPAISQLIITDSSQKMLSHSMNMRSERINLVVCDADNLPFENSSIDYVISMLGDPYNQREFWLESFRALRSGGKGIFTTPSWQWAANFRSSSADEHQHYAFFMKTTGESIYVPSYILKERDQIDLMLECGIFVERLEHYTSEKLNLDSNRISEKISGYVGSDESVVTAYHFRKA